MKYYIIREDGSSVFMLPYPEDFCYHCLFKLLDVTDENFRLMRFVEASEFSAVQADWGTGGKPPVFALLEPERQGHILTYIRK